MKINIIFMIIGILCLGVIGFIMSMDNEEEKKIVPCYDNKGNEIQGLECVQNRNMLVSKIVFSILFGLMACGCFWLNYKFEKWELEEKGE